MSGRRRSRVSPPSGLHDGPGPFLATLPQRVIRDAAPGGDAQRVDEAERGVRHSREHGLEFPVAHDYAAAADDGGALLERAVQQLGLPAAAPPLAGNRFRSRFGQACCSDQGGQARPRTGQRPGRGQERQEAFARPGRSGRSGRAGSAATSVT